MKIKITETGKMEKLEIIDPKTGINYIVDLMGNHGALPGYNENEDCYEMKQEEFGWWADLTSRLESAEKAFQKALEVSENPENLHRARQEAVNYCDLEDLPERILEAIEGETMKKYRCELIENGVVKENFLREGNSAAEVKAGLEMFYWPAGEWQITKN